MIGSAFEFALRQHAGQVDKGGAPYIGHVARVCARVEGDAERVVALLHDTLEDTEASEDVIRQKFGETITDAVVALTKRGNEPNEKYIMRVAKNKLAIPVKLADIADNSDPVRLAALPAETSERLRRKYTKARAQLEAVYAPR